MALRSRQAASARARRRRRRIEVAQSLEALPRLFGVDAQRRRIRQLLQLLLEPREPPQARELLLQAIGERQQVVHVIERVVDLFGGQRAARPVGARV